MNVAYIRESQAAGVLPTPKNSCFRCRETYLCTDLTSKAARTFVGE